MKNRPPFPPEFGEAQNERLFQCSLGALVLQVKEFEDERVFYGFFGCPNRPPKTEVAGSLRVR
jgi:hypothetical protein